MNYAAKLLWICAGILAGVLSLHFFGFEAFAAEKTGNWRPTYDLIMRWVNFGIIVFVVNKYGKTPLMNLLRGRKESVAREIRELEDKRNDMTAKVKESQNFITESDVRFVELKERIVRLGERRKEDIIASARQQSRVMLDDAHRRIQSHVLGAKITFRAELIDAAIDLAMERLPQEIDAADNEKFVNEYLLNA